MERILKGLTRYVIQKRTGGRVSFERHAGDAAERASVKQELLIQFVAFRLTNGK